MAGDAGASLEVSAVIPCLNEAVTVGACVRAAREAMEAAGLRGEVVVADNGSTDGSPEVALEHGARVVHVASRGYGSALAAGIDAAEGPLIVIGDADESYDFGDIPRFVEKLREGFDVVIGNRFAGGIQPGAMPWLHRYVGNPVLSRLLRFLFKPGDVHDAHCGIRGFTKAVYQRMDMRTTGMEFASEFVIKAAHVRARMTEIPVTLWPDRRGRPPHLRSFPDGWRHLRFMLMFSPNWLFLVPGGALGALGTFLVFWLLPGQRSVAGQDFGLHTMLFGTLLAMIGLEIVSIGLFAKVFCHSSRFGLEDRTLESALKRMSLERGLLLGGALVFAGAAGLTWLLLRWVADGADAFVGVRPLIVSTFLGSVGLHIVFASFFLSMLGISRDTFVGDYEDQEPVATDPG